MKIPVYFLALFLTFFNGEWGANLEFALDKAKSEQKLVLLNFSGSDWCGPCILLKKDIFNNTDFVSFANKNLELVRADFPRQKKNKLTSAQKLYNESLAERYNPEGKFPFTLLLSNSGKVLYTWEGYPKGFTLEKFLKDIEAKM